METIYIFTDGDIRRKNGALYLKPKKDGTKSLYVPLKSVSSLMIFSEVTINKRFLDLLSKEGIPAFFYGYYGNFVGSFYPPENNKTGEMLVQQFKHYNDAEKRLYIAREILNAATDNMLYLLNNYKETVMNEIEYIKKLKLTFDKQDNIPALMAIEGNIRRMYYTAIGKIVGRKNFVFVERIRRPPKDEINALISFGNVVLYNIVLTEIYKTSLEPRISFLHEPNKRKFSLQLDISEVFKPIIVDKVILKLINKNIIKKDDFEKVTDGVYLTKDGKKKFIEELEKRLETKIYLYKDQKVSFKTVILHECYKLIRHLKSEENYKGFRMKG
ncbi:MAG: type I-B CRISPR-associated endonuclease Cas1 [Thermosipho sp. (in: Bacteria)]|nr:type I-B CRISPR-associated endonuclease Cas1 [Thermosipho sp. (in: thermotogales)]